MKQMPWAWQKSPTRSCSSSGDSVSTTTCTGAVSGCHCPGAGGGQGVGARAHLEGGEEVLQQLPGVSLHRHVGAQLGQDPLGRLGTVPANVTLPQEELWARGGAPRVLGVLHGTLSALVGSLR